MIEYDVLWNKEEVTPRVAGSSARFPSTAQKAVLHCDVGVP